MINTHNSVYVVILIAVAVNLVAGDCPCRAESEDHHTPIPPEKIHQFQEQVVELGEIATDGYILAIGGGGESVIGQLMGRQVVAIDISRRELEHAPGDALKIIMDARDLLFLDKTFDTAASFFTLMYIDGADHPRVFEEAYRVLRPGGRFLVWDASFGKPPEGKTVGVVPLTVKLPKKVISTGYGVRWPEEPHDLAYYKRLALAAGFKLTKESAKDQWFYLEMQKPAS
jgi:ubiquinone/menaquinone biosynthesis C-methylase UbiE